MDLQELRRAVAAHGQWVKSGGAEGARLDLSETSPHFLVMLPDGTDLSRAILRGAHLNGADLRGAILREANLSEAYCYGADLNRASLDGANLGGANLHEAKLSWAFLRRADFNGADLMGANLTGANLYGANLSRAMIAGTTFTDVDLSETHGLAECNHLGPSFVDFSTLERSPDLPDTFLLGCGLPDWLVEAYKLARADSEGERTEAACRLELAGDAPISFYSVFISHTSADKPFARALHDELQKHGIRCWLDEKQILPGEDILERIDHGIRHWDKLILCCSEPALNNSWWVEEEIEKSLQKERDLKRDEGRDVSAVIPLDLDGYLNRWSSPLKTVLRKRLAGDFKGWKEGKPLPTASVEALIAALRTDDGAREPVPEPKL